MIDSSQTALKGLSNSYNIHYTELIKAIIIYVASFSSFFAMLLRKSHDQKEDMRAKLALTSRTAKKGASQKEETL